MLLSIGRLAEDERSQFPVRSEPTISNITRRSSHPGHRVTKNLTYSRKLTQNEVTIYTNCQHVFLEFVSGLRLLLET